MRQEIPTWLFVVIVVIVVAIAAGIIWWRTSTQRLTQPFVSPEEMKQEWKVKLQKGYFKPPRTGP